MNYSELGLVNTVDMFADAIRRHYAVPAFNFYNMETLSAILAAAREKRSPVMLAVSESALKYMGGDMLVGMILGANIKPAEQIALHLDHGGGVDVCAQAIELGFSSVMIDASKLPFDENIDITRQVVKLAHARNVSVEAELGVLAGIEDETTASEYSNYTNPADVEKFVQATGIDSLAIAIGTSHGAYKRKSEGEELRFDILADVAARLPGFPLVLHGASSIPQDLVKIINDFGGNMPGARGIDVAQLRRATQMNVCKINVDSDLRLAFTAALRQSLSEKSENFNPREFLGAAKKLMTVIAGDEIENIMGSAGKLNSDNFCL
ncbi:MAG: ketose-bisphosphate aldolase [Alphaproteobacteria bacterium]|nr:ketose-bisphosphate aldolase [Alphaproteobacteria bacterium]